jgi:hypothetical protein
MDLSILLDHFTERAPSTRTPPEGGPKHKIFEHGIFTRVFTQIRPERVGDLGTRPKSQKLMVVVALYCI